MQHSVNDEGNHLEPGGAGGGRLRGTGEGWDRSGAPDLGVGSVLPGAAEGGALDGSAVGGARFAEVVLLQRMHPQVMTADQPKVGCVMLHAICTLQPLPCHMLPQSDQVCNLRQGKMVKLHAQHSAGPPWRWSPDIAILQCAAS